MPLEVGTVLEWEEPVRNEAMPLASLSQASSSSAANSPLEPQEGPRHEQEVAGPGLDRAGPRKEEIRKAVTDGCQPEFVDCRGLPEEVDDAERSAPVPLRVVKPGQRRHHLTALLRLLP